MKPHSLFSFLSVAPRLRAETEADISLWMEKKSEKKKHGLKSNGQTALEMCGEKEMDQYVESNKGRRIYWHLEIIWNNVNTAEDLA